LRNFWGYVFNAKVQGKIVTVPRALGLDSTHCANTLTLADLEFRPTQRFRYEYNFIDGWQLEVRIERLCQVDAAKMYPRCIGGKRAAPPEDCGGAASFMRQLEKYSPVFLQSWLLDLYDLLTQEDKEIPEWEWEVEARQEELDELRYWMQVDRFRRRPINDRLKLYVAGDDTWRQLAEV